MADDYTAAREILLKEREKLVHHLKELGATESGDLRSDLDFGEGFSDAGTVITERTEVLGIVESLKVHLAEVDASLGRIADNTYGICARCSNRISPERMEARPRSRLCVKCKSARR